MRLGDLDALKEDMKSRLSYCNEWIEKAKDKETKIRASAVKSFIAEVIMTIDNAPTVDVEITEKQAITKIINSGWLVKHDKELRDRWERPQGEWIKKVDDVGFISHICSKCGAEIELEDPCDNKFCFNCGADMGGVK